MIRLPIKFMICNPHTSHMCVRMCTRTQNVKKKKNPCGVVSIRMQFCGVHGVQPFVVDIYIYAYVYVVCLFRICILYGVGGVGVGAVKERGSKRARRFQYCYNSDEIERDGQGPPLDLQAAVLDHELHEYAGARPVMP
jgi:hypothetical protein